MKKKSLLLAISAMSIAAIGVGTVGTFAWYAATQTSNRETVAATGSLGADSEALADGTYYIVPVWGNPAEVDATAEHLGTAGEHKLSLTDSGGECFAAVNVGTNEEPSYIAAAAQPKYKKHADATVDFKVYKTRSANTPYTYTDEVTNNAAVMKTLQGTYNFKISSAENRVKLSKVNAAGSYGAAYGTAIPVTVTISSAGEISDDLATVWVSLGGTKTATANVAAGDAIALADIDSSAIAATVTCGPAV